MDPRQPPREPILTLPGALTAYVGLLIAIHVVRTLLLPEAWDDRVLWVFAFIPMRYDTSLLAIPIAGGAGAKVWTFLTYSLLHANLPHILFNILWLLPFGSAVARRFGAVRFFLFMAGSGGARGARDADAAAKVPAQPLSRALRDSRVLGFLAVWFGVNIVFGVGSIGIGTEGVSVAWQAHIGGFFAGLLLFSLFDPVPRHGGPIAVPPMPD